MTFPYKLFQLHSYCVNIAKQRQSACLILGATYSSAIGRFSILVGCYVSKCDKWWGVPQTPTSPFHACHVWEFGWAPAWLSDSSVCWLISSYQWWIVCSSAALCWWNALVSAQMLQLNCLQARCGLRAAGWPPLFNEKGERLLSEMEVPLTGCKGRNSLLLRMPM